MTGSELRLLLEQYLEDTLSEEDHKKLFDSLANEETASLWEPLMDELLNSAHLKGLSDQKSQHLALMKIRTMAAGSLQTPTAPTPVRNLTRWKTIRWVAASSVLIILSVTMLLWTHKKNDTIVAVKPVSDSLTNDILPGGEKAILTLSDGSTISLDDANKGSIGKQGESDIEKREEGQLVYHSDGKLGKKVLFNTLSTPRGGQYELVLPDGTKVWLNAASSITYPVAFNGNSRKVNITGEAYLEVAPDKSKPFLVDVNGSMSIEVLGTHFNVNSYADEGQINTTLLEGKIKLAMNGTQGAVLSPRQQAQVNTSSSGRPIKVVNNANLEEVMAWKNGYFHFTNTSLESMMRQVERWYDVKVEYPQTTPQLRFAGEIKRDLTLSQLLEGLSEMGVNVERKGRTLYVNP